VGRHPHGLAEDTAQVERAETGVLGQSLEGDVLLRVLLQVLHTKTDRVSFPAGRSWNLGRLPVAAGQQDEGLGEVRLAFEHARPGRFGEPVETAEAGGEVAVPDDVPAEPWLWHLFAARAELGRAWMSGTTFGGRRAVRVSVSNWQTNESDVARTLQALRDAVS